MLKIKTPPKPPDPSGEGRPVSWVAALAAPGYFYSGRWTDVDAAWIDALVERQNAFQAPGYYPPVLREHRADGEREGDIVSAARGEDETGRAYLVLAVAWVDPEAPDNFKAGRWRYGSPFIDDVTDERGVTHRGVIREWSLTGAPHQKHLGPTHFIGAESNGNAMELEQILARLEAAEAELAALKAAQAAPAEAEMSDPADASKPAPEPAAMAELRNRAEAAEKALRRAKAAAAFSGPVVMSEGGLDALSNLDAADLDAVCKALKPAPQPGAAKPHRALGTDYTARMGETAGQPNNNNDAAALYARCLAETGGDARKALDLYKTRR